MLPPRDGRRWTAPMDCCRAVRVVSNVAGIRRTPMMRRSGSHGREVEEDEDGPTRGRPSLARVVQRLGEGTTIDAESKKGPQWMNAAT